MFPEAPKFTGYFFNEQGFYLYPLEVKYEQIDDWDEVGNWIGHFEKVIPPDCTDIEPPDYRHKPQWNGSEWIKTIDPIPDPPEPLPPPKPEIEIVKEQLAIMMEGLDSIFAGEGSVSKYLAARIKDGKLDYTRVIDKRPDLKAEIDFILNSKTEI